MKIMQSNRFKTKWFCNIAQWTKVIFNRWPDCVHKKRRKNLYQSRNSSLLYFKQILKVSWLQNHFMKRQQAPQDLKITFYYCNFWLVSKSYRAVAWASDHTRAEPNQFTKMFWKFWIGRGQLEYAVNVFKLRLLKLRGISFLNNKTIVST